MVGRELAGIYIYTHTDWNTTYSFPLHMQNALSYISQEIKSATTSMTSVPKPLKFLQGHYSTLVSLHEAMEGGRTPSNTENLHVLADILSVLAMTMSAADSRDCLKCVDGCVVVNNFPSLFDISHIDVCCFLNSTLVTS